MRMQKRQFRIGELAKHLGVERFVIRFWEKEFNLRPTRSDGGQRFYEEKDLKKMQMIKSLLYDKGYTIAGARRALKEAGSIKASQKTTLDMPIITVPYKEIDQELKNIRQRLVQLQEML